MWRSGLFVECLTASCCETLVLSLSTMHVRCCLPKTAHLCHASSLSCRRRCQLDAPRSVADLMQRGTLCVECFTAVL